MKFEYPISNFYGLNLTVQEIHHHIGVHANAGFKYLVLYVIVRIVIERNRLFGIDGLQTFVRPLGVLAS